MKKKSKIIGYEDKMLPIQRENSHFYKGNELYRVIYEEISLSSNFDRIKLAIDNVEEFSLEEMGSNQILINLLMIIIILADINSILEIGTFIGNTTIFLAKAIPETGSITTIEKYKKFADTAAENFKKNNVDKLITLIHGDALQVIESFSQNKKFDMIFIDGDKENYKNYFLLSEKLLSSKGVIIIDDCFFHGDVLNTPPETEKGKGVREFLDYMQCRTDLNKILLPISNGVMIVALNKHQEVA